jgi:Mg2+ and Co2+ transporter CorA
MEAGKTITQNDINAKLFYSLEKLEAKMDNFETKLSERMDNFESRINAQMNWQLAIFTVIMVGVLAKVITA